MSRDSICLNIQFNITAAEEKNVATLRKLAEQFPEFKHILIEKAEVQEKKHHIVTNEAAFAKLLDQVDAVLQEVEKELSSRKGNKMYLSFFKCLKNCIFTKAASILRCV